jgi:hypothetical protein
MTSSTRSGVRATDLSATEMACHGLIDAATALRANVDLLADPAMGTRSTRADAVGEAYSAIARIAGAGAQARATEKKSCRLPAAHGQAQR